MENQKQVIWWKDRRLIAGWLLVIISALLGLYGKGLLGVFFAKLVQEIYEPFWLITGLSVYALSWMMLFLGVFLVGWETIKIIRQRIHTHVKTGVKKTYNYTRQLPQKSYQYTKKLHKKLTQSK